MKFEDYLAPWEIGADGKKLDEPAELDADKLKRHLFNLQEDKDKLQADVTDLTGQVAAKSDDLTRLQQEKESAEERVARENRERDERYAALEKRDWDRQKLETLEDHFKDQGIESARARRLAARVTGDDENAWIASANELVEDGFRLTDKVVEQQEEQQEDTAGDDLRSRPARRANGQPAAVNTGKGKSVAEQVDAFIPISGW